MNTNINIFHIVHNDNTSTNSSISIGLVTEEELQGNRLKRYSKKVVQPVLSLEGKVSNYLINYNTYKLYNV